MIKNNNYLQLKTSNCKNCYKCIRHCPVKSIKFSGNQAHIVADECVLCGTCYVVCPQSAKEIRNDVSNVRELLSSGKPVIASIAPSFAANYKNATIASMDKALRKLGFAFAEETAVGAEIVKNQYIEMLKCHESDVIISSCCSTINLLIQKYYPELIPMLAHVLTPMQTHCKKLKEENSDCYTVFIGPCVSKKSEADQYEGYADAVLTFKELTNWLKDENIELEHDEDIEKKGRSRLFPTNGGILRSMTSKEETDYNFIAVSGTENCLKALEDIKSGGIKNCFIEMSSCDESCIGGPAMDTKNASPVSGYIAVSRYAGQNDVVDKNYSREEMYLDFVPSQINTELPTEKQIAEILMKMGKTRPEDELNCGSCGYNTCREKAKAVFSGKADFTMCLPYLKDKAESFSDNIINNTPNGILVLNEDFEVQLINKAACKIMNVKNPSDVLGSPVVRILNPTEYISVLNDGKNVYEKKTFLAEYQKYVEETIIHDSNYHVIMSIMRDITNDEAERSKKENTNRQAIEITDKVIEKQMRVVQEIASLLGETTAETKIALSKLKETLTDE